MDPSHGLSQYAPGGMLSPGKMQTVEELRDALRMSMKELIAVQAECERTKNIQNEFESLWRGMERLMTQHRPLTGKDGEVKQVTGGAGGVSSASIKELLGRIDGALLHVDQVLAKEPPSRAAVGGKENQIEAKGSGASEAPDQEKPPTHPGSDSKESAITPPARKKRQAQMHPSLTGALSPPAGGTVMITAQPFISPIPSTKTPRDTPLPSPGGDGHITVHGLQMVDADGDQSSRSGKSAVYNEVEGLDVCPSPVVSPMPKAETARGKSDSGESVAHNMQDALDEMRNCADRIHDVLKESTKPHGDGQVTACLGFADSMHGRVVYPETSMSSADLSQNKTLSPLRPPSPPPRPPPPAQFYPNSYRLEGENPSPTPGGGQKHMVRVDLAKQSWPQKHQGSAIHEYCDVPVAPPSTSRVSVFSSMVSRDPGRSLRPVVLSTSKGAAVITRQDMASAGMVSGRKENLGNNGVWGALVPPPRRDHGQRRVLSNAYVL